MTSQESTNKLSRRDFMKGAAVGGVVAAVAVGGGATLAWPKGAAEPGNVPAKWDKETDVVVVGSGTVSIAGVVAADGGAKVVVLEKAAVFGGTTSLSGGGMWVPNNYLMQQANVKDTKEEALKYLQVVSEGQSSDELMTQYLDKAPEMIEWLRDHANFTWQRNAPGAFADYYPFATGAHDSTTTRLIFAAARADKTTSGKALMLNAREALEARKAEIMLETPAKRLVTNEKGEVIGIIAESNGKEIAIKANLGVVLGTGGFDFNKEMTTAYLRGPIYFSVAVPTNTGDGHLMGMAVGADLRNMNSAWGLPGYMPKPGTTQSVADWQMYRGKPGAITVNKYGERFMNEGTMYHPALRAWYFYDTGKYEYRNLPSFAMFDSGYTARYMLPGTTKVGDVPDWITKANTLDELAKALGVDPDGLKKTVERFNVNAKAGVDPDWHRGESDNERFTGGDLKRVDIKNPSLAPLETPPFYGANLWPGTCGTNGGLRTNANAQVLNVWGKPIVGLYASGNTMASVMGAAYPGGGATVGSGCTFAYIAAKHILTRKPQA
jgi:succinate dehydrogenase/fumarate reductase flavoprotein subunit